MPSAASHGIILEEPTLPGSKSKRVSELCLDLVTHPVAGPAFLLLQFAALYLVVDRFHIETAPFRLVLTLSFGAYLVHQVLPAGQRLRWFAWVSLASVFIVFGMDKGTWSAEVAVQRGLPLVGIVCGVLALCHLPVAIGWRVLILLGVGVTLCAARGGWLPNPVPPAIWAIVGSMLMFRAIVYLYDLHAGRLKTTPAGMASYGLMLPNVCFPLFPVVDSKAFFRGHEDGPRLLNQQIGLSWMMRGVVQLVLYRVVYYDFYLDPARVSNGAEVVGFALTNYLLYLRVSGQFHLIVGLLRMFGFNLPETHHRYYLASSFTDYWRRVNIYWKDFILKLVYLPLMFRLKRLNPAAAMTVATLAAFGVTWFLHSYQWFWLRGSFLFAMHDMIFWGVLALLVTINALWEAKRGRRRSLGARGVSVAEAAVKALKTAGTFLVLCVLWSLWSSRSVDDWLAMVAMADIWTLVYGLLILTVVAALALVPDDWWPPGPAKLNSLPPRRQAAEMLRLGLTSCLIPAAILTLATTGRVQKFLGPEARTFIRSLQRETKPSEGDTTELERGYYEDLIDVGLVNSPLSEVYIKRPAEWLRLEQTDAMRLTGDYRFRELVPSQRTVVNGVTYTTNVHGMRDRERSVAKPAGVFRIALIGASYVMGWSVEQDATFAHLLEQKLAGMPLPEGVREFEVLNFGVNGYSAICQTIALERQVLQFEPDLVIYVAHGSEPFWTVNRLTRAVRDGAAVPGDVPQHILSVANVEPHTSQLVGERRLMPHWRKLVRWAYRSMVQQCVGRGAQAVWIYLTAPGTKPAKASHFAELRQMAEEAGFVALDTRDTYGKIPIDEIIVAPWDHHPNARGHALIADALYRVLLENPALLQARTAEPSAGVSGP